MERFFVQCPSHSHGTSPAPTSRKRHRDTYISQPRHDSHPCSPSPSPQPISSSRPSLESASKGVPVQRHRDSPSYRYAVALPLPTARIRENFDRSPPLPRSPQHETLATTATWIIVESRSNLGGITANAPPPPPSGLGLLSSIDVARPASISLIPNTPRSHSRLIRALPRQSTVRYRD
jgi:hypothetical protein